MSEKTFKIRKIDIKQGAFEILMNAEDAHDLALKTHDRVSIVPEGLDGKTVIVNTTETLVEKGEVGVFHEVWEDLDVNEGSNACVVPVPKPRSVEYIKRKIRGKPLTKEEMRELVKDIAKGNISQIELTAYVVAVQIRDLSMDEIVAATNAFVETGQRIDFTVHPIFDVHSIGGVPGNKYAPIAIPILAANGVTIPKTSSRAISSPAGTADLMECITGVEHDAAGIKQIAEDVGGTLVWGGGVNFAPADDIIIKVEHPLSLDPHGQVLTSVMAKKLAVGVEKLLIDIPTGENTKVPDKEEARRLARDFIELGRRVGIEVRAAITYGGQPVGRTMGPALEIKEAMTILEGSAKPNSTIEKALELSGIILEMAEIVRPGGGKAEAGRTLTSGLAHQKFLEIVEAQGGDPAIRSEDIEAGPFTAEFPAPKDGYVIEIHNRRITRVARRAGCPRDKGAGIYMNKKRGEMVDKDEALFTIYSESEWKLKDALKLAKQTRPYTIEGMILEDVIE